MTPGVVTADEALAAMVDDLHAHLRDAARVIVGITGPPGVGKSTVARRLVDALGASASYLPMDGFHLATTQLERLGRRDRRGAPDTFDVDGYAAILVRVAAGYGARDVYVPDFDRAVGEPVAAALVVPSQAQIVVTEGNYLALWEDVRDRLDRFYYLDADPELRRSRLISRHVAGGRSEADARRWADEVDGANADRIAATRNRCDRVFDVVEAP
ncbi:nucleoside/nucleotide kinase family protein [Mycobacterium sp. 852013-51886_SCH5428379]|uniref:nucleoside/nucleotide kinase family protein n=1 Tax=Mycobacterium sp. 852013-51886_SCH5428379 TaxID=1834111 RepID=UPI0007FE8E1C|nr:nucleoside/nucleotide kinase family protein [Mycobacterium sp. 852013-51886_SCH5428379]OBB59282.1 nucleoside/nucleotide kinase family protein [Mycobacterium sp. 852013-51886_SCH5428379]